MGPLAHQPLGLVLMPAPEMLGIVDIHIHVCRVSILLPNNEAIEDCIRVRVNYVHDL